MSLSYLDFNATAPLRPEALAAMQAALAETGNPSSVHRAGRAARRRVEDAREAVAALVGANAREIVFTGGGTEANNLAIFGTAPERLIVSAIEHDAVLAAAHSTDAPVTIIPATPDGVVDRIAFAAALAGTGPGTLVSLMLANNETGVLQPVAELAAQARVRGALVHCDAVQAAGKINIDFKALNVDLLTLSAHKLGGPQGVGALVVREGLDLDPVQRGGGQERGLRAGTENVAGIAGFGAAAAASRPADYAALQTFRDGLEQKLLSYCSEAIIYGSSVSRLPNTTCVRRPGIGAETQVMALDLAGVAVSAGSACSSGKLRPSHVLTAMGYDDIAAREAIRISLGWTTTPADIDRAVQAWAGLRVPAAAA
jgi:cysteine desulfurase